MGRDRSSAGVGRTGASAFRTPARTTILTGVVVAFAAVSNINEVVELCNIGTLFAFVLVSSGVIILAKPIRRRVRSASPLVPRVPMGAILMCGCLMAELPWVTWLRFVIWLALGLGSTSVTAAPTSDASTKAEALVSKAHPNESDASACPPPPHFHLFLA